MIKMTALRSFGIPGANEGKVRRGREFTAATPHRAKELEGLGLAYPLDVQNKSMDVPVHAETSQQNKAAHAGPLHSVGGETGEDKQSSLLAPDRVQEKRTYRKRMENSEP